MYLARGGVDIGRQGGDIGRDEFFQFTVVEYLCHDRVFLFQVLQYLFRGAVLPARGFLRLGVYLQGIEKDVAYLLGGVDIEWRTG